jgi:hypothetical protein
MAEDTRDTVLLIPVVLLEIKLVTFSDPKEERDSFDNRGIFKCLSKIIYIFINI